MPSSTKQAALVSRKTVTPPVSSCDESSRKTPIKAKRNTRQQALPESPSPSGHTGRQTVSTLANTLLKHDHSSHVSEESESSVGRKTGFMPRAYINSQPETAAPDVSDMMSVVSDGSRFSVIVSRVRKVFDRQRQRYNMQADDMSESVAIVDPQHRGMLYKELDAVRQLRVTLDQIQKCLEHDMDEDGAFVPPEFIEIPTACLPSDLLDI